MCVKYYLAFKLCVTFIEFGSCLLMIDDWIGLPSSVFHTLTLILMALNGLVRAEVPLRNYSIALPPV